jgi:hypothetical protein
LGEWNPENDGLSDDVDIQPLDDEGSKYEVKEYGDNKEEYFYPGICFKETNYYFEIFGIRILI